MNKYRTDIQGMRALAVILVVLFHFNPTLLTGGFIGVDVFFVISGYLMTSIVVRGVNSNSFSLKSFYLARVVRIIPALLLLCTSLSILGFTLLNLVDASNLAKHALSSITFISNITYWTESGYFDDASKYNWLLHTWSLSVEWQFYIVFPIVVLFLSKLFSFRAIGYVIIFAVLSGFALSVWASQAMPSAAYFLLPTRAWELLIGGLAFFYQVPKQLSKKTRSTMEALGLALIIISALIITDEMAWPGYAAALPVSAALLILFANNQNSLLTGNAIAQAIGKWSYSIYLWHWPIVVCINYFELPYWTMIIGMPLSIVLGWLSYQFCETKFSSNPEKSKSYGPKHVLVSLCAVVSLGLSFTYFKDQIYKQDLANIEPFIAGQKYFTDSGLSDATAGSTYFFNGATKDNFDYLAIGDSNLSHYAYGIKHRGEQKVVLSWEGFCLSLPNYITMPTESYMNKTWQNYCENNYKNINLYPDKPVILANLWQARKMMCVTEPCTIEPSKANFYHLLEQQLGELMNIIGEQRMLIIIGQVPAPSSSVFKCMKGFNSQACSRMSDESGNERIKVNKVLAEFSNKHSNVKFINPFNASCNSELVCKTVIDGKSLFHDEGHFSAFGSVYFWNYISAQLGPNPNMSRG